MNKFERKTHIKTFSTTSLDDLIEGQQGLEGEWTGPFCLDLLSNPMISEEPSNPPSFANFRLDEHILMLQQSLKAHNDYFHFKKTPLETYSKMFDGPLSSNCPAKPALNSTLSSAINHDELLSEFIEHIINEYPNELGNELLILISKIYEHFNTQKGKIREIDSIVSYSLRASEKLACKLFKDRKMPILTFKNSSGATQTKFYEGFKTFVAEFYATVALVIEEIYVNPQLIKEKISLSSLTSMAGSIEESF